MKCPNCSAEWLLPVSVPTQLKTCPFCGENLPIESVESLTTIDAVLVEIVRRFGVDMLRNGSKTVAIFSDLAPHMRKERLLLSYLTQFDGNNKLLEVKHLAQTEQWTTYQKVVQHLTDEQFVAQPAAENVCNCFLKAIGVTITPEPTVHSKPISTPNVPEKQQALVTPVTLSRRTTQPASKSLPQKPPVMVKSFEAYTKLLEEYYIRNGKVKLSYQQIKYFISSNNLDVDWKITYADVEKDLEKLYVKYAPPKPTTRAVSPPAKNQIASISNYEEYMRALERLYLDNGKCRLSKAQISGFLSLHQLDLRFKIQISDVEKDLSTIYAKYSPPRYVAKPAMSPPRVQSKSLSSYKEYMEALEKLYIDNGKRMLSKAQMAGFITSNNLDSKFGIQVSEVETDLQTIAEKHRQYSYLTNILQQKTTKERASLINLLSQVVKKK